MSYSKIEHKDDHLEYNAMEERMLAFIFPNTPVTQAEKDAFGTAVLHQIAHEKAMADSLEVDDVNLPNGVKEFHIGNFSMAFGDEGYRAVLLRARCFVASLLCFIAYLLSYVHCIVCSAIQNKCIETLLTLPFGILERVLANIRARVLPCINVARTTTTQHLSCSMRTCVCFLFGSSVRSDEFLC